jgi:hypothetical protein
MATCPHPKKLHHKTQRQAFNQLRDARSHQNHPGGGRSLKALEVYYCPCGGGWCVGHSKHRKTVIQESQPQTKQRSLSEIKRIVKRIEIQMDNLRKHRAYVAGQLVDADNYRTQLEQQMRDAQNDALRQLGIIP